MKLIPAILFLLLFFTTTAQQIIKGKVVNAATGATIPGSSIFIANSSNGTTSDNNGYFALYDVPVGTHELIISCIGYATNVFSFSDKQLPLQLKVELDIKAKELSNVTLEPSVEEGWDKWGKTFLDNFVGTTENANRCHIKNEKAIKFRYYKKSNRLIAYCNEPVLLENKALGYMVKYQLEEFELNFKEHTVFYIGYSLYEPLDKGGKVREKKWDNRREEAYNGSIMHFMHSLYRNTLLEEGFEVRRMVRSPNYEKERVKELQKTLMLRTTNESNGQVSIGYAPTISHDSIDYYQRILRQENYIDTYAGSLLTADSLITAVSGEFKGLSFDDYIFVTFKNEVEETAYLKTQFPLRRATYQRSYVTLLGDKLISLDKNGNYYNPQDFLSSAYWGWSEKMSNSLPLDYKKTGN